MRKEEEKDERWSKNKEGKESSNIESKDEREEGRKRKGKER